MTKPQVHVHYHSGGNVNLHPGQIIATIISDQPQDKLYPFSDHISVPLENNPMLSGYTVDGREYYVDLSDKQLKRRPANPATISKMTIKADDKDVCKIENCPPNTRFFIDHALHQLEENGSIELTSPTANRYFIILFCWPYLQVDFWLTATDETA